MYMYVHVALGILDIYCLRYLHVRMFEQTSKYIHVWYTSKRIQHASHGGTD